MPSSGGELAYVGRRRRRRRRKDGPGFGVSPNLVDIDRMLARNDAGRRTLDLKFAGIP